MPTPPDFNDQVPQDYQEFFDWDPLYRDTDNVHQPEPGPSSRILPLAPAPHADRMDYPAPDNAHASVGHFVLSQQPASAAGVQLSNPPMSSDANTLPGYESPPLSLDSSALSPHSTLDQPHKLLGYRDGPYYGGSTRNPLFPSKFRHDAPFIKPLYRAIHRTAYQIMLRDYANEAPARQQELALRAANAQLSEIMKGVEQDYARTARRLEIRGELIRLVVPKAERSAQKVAEDALQELQDKFRET
ncbi:hypothetical protein L202_03164 [Cryptococcus amylolentus CBS 6039]|uniref:Uncharacterized protein n=1 Tax=Cryptococcus amylolentus CBS 6039 TaxID=1295533 RepID=A0A1E3HXP6_9TREE|nr:hypothetical protein L202_03164 [Cryptococcus amylolentus CBS 6039]ODN81069.1 hypothetical protein L202_03164 [Cryptococcus amylolentus CBS 6039]